MLRGLAILALASLVSGCAEDRAPAGEFAWNLPAGVPPPLVPADNPMTAARVELGRFLFYDTRLSGNQEQSCQSCHLQGLAFADGRVAPRGSTGELGPRNAPPLMNAAYYATFNWMNPELTALEQQIAIPLFGEDPVELGVGGREEVVLARFADDPRYRELFARAFPDDADPIDFDNVIAALACFVRSMVSFDSPYDRYTYGGDLEAMSPAALRGLALVQGDELACHRCHDGLQLALADFANNGLYDVDGLGSYPAPSDGLHLFTGDDADRGKLRIPSLRNLTVTAPYMHDGSVATLEDVLRHYAAGGTGSANQSEHVHGFDLTDDELADLLALFDALTDRTFLFEPAFSDPFRE